MVLQRLLAVGGGLGAQRLGALGGRADGVGEGFEVELGIDGESVERGDGTVHRGLEGFVAKLGGVVGRGLGGMGVGRHCTVS